MFLLFCGEAHQLRPVFLWIGLQKGPFEGAGKRASLGWAHQRFESNIFPKSPIKKYIYSSLLATNIKRRSHLISNLMNEERERENVDRSQTKHHINPNPQQWKTLIYLRIQIQNDFVICCLIILYSLHLGIGTQSANHLF